MPQKLAGVLRRLIPPLLTQGIRVSPPHPKDRTRTYSVVKEALANAQNAQTPENVSGASESGTTARALPPDTPQDRPQESPTSEPPSDAAGAESRRSGDLGVLPPPSDDDEEEFI